MGLTVFRSPELTYAEVGATAALPLPHGYQHLRYRTSLGAVSFEDAAEAIQTFAMHRAAGIAMLTDAERAANGVRVTVSLGIGSLRVSGPCAVVLVFDDKDRRGFAYGTLTGHPERGEEAFLVTRESGIVFFEVRAFSRPARWFTRIGEPFIPIGQRLYSQNLARALRKLVAKP
jgi:uncharacterized protein (UPF0548 family)